MSSSRSGTCTVRTPILALRRQAVRLWATSCLAVNGRRERNFLSRILPGEIQGKTSLGSSRNYAIVNKIIQVQFRHTDTASPRAVCANADGVFVYQPIVKDTTPDTLPEYRLIFPSCKSYSLFLQKKTMHLICELFSEFLPLHPSIL